MRNDRYILRGRTPIPEPDLLSWAQWIESHERHVDSTTIGKFEVSTVFLGLDHNFFTGSDKPILFETMVFKLPRPSTKEIMAGADCSHRYDNIQERYHTWEEAQAGHLKIVARIKRRQANGMD